MGFVGGAFRKGINLVNIVTGGNWTSRFTAVGGGAGLATGVFMSQYDSNYNNPFFYVASTLAAAAIGSMFGKGIDKDIESKRVDEADEKVAKSVANIVYKKLEEKVNGYLAQQRTGLEEVRATYETRFAEMQQAIKSFIETAGQGQRAIEENLDCLAGSLGETKKLILGYEQKYQELFERIEGIGNVGEVDRKLEDVYSQISGSLESIKSSIAEGNSLYRELNKGLEGYHEGIAELSDLVRKIDEGMGRREERIREGIEDLIKKYDEVTGRLFEELKSVKESIGLEQSGGSLRYEEISQRLEAFEGAIAWLKENQRGIVKSAEEAFDFVRGRFGELTPVVDMVKSLEERLQGVADSLGGVNENIGGIRTELSGVRLTEGFSEEVTQGYKILEDRIGEFGKRLDDLVGVIHGSGEIQIDYEKIRQLVMEGQEDIRREFVGFNEQLKDVREMIRGAVEPFEEDLGEVGVGDPLNLVRIAETPSAPKVRRKISFRGISKIKDKLKGDYILPALGCGAFSSAATYDLSGDNLFLSILAGLFGFSLGAFIWKKTDIV